MPDTAVLKTPQGWVDRDAPAQTFSTRWQARDFRRTRIAQRTAAVIGAIRLGNTTMTNATVTVTNAGTATTVSAHTMTPLEVRLFNRMVVNQGIPASEARDVIEKYTYNKAASYGHMRAAGANPAEATIVVELGNPTVSLKYGRLRANHMDHTDALAEAFKG